jgi:hypothetical protein
MPLSFKGLASSRVANRVSEMAARNRAIRGFRAVRKTGILPPTAFLAYAFGETHG